VTIMFFWRAVTITIMFFWSAVTISTLGGFA
jgi:hypothetical protein